MSPNQFYLKKQEDYVYEPRYIKKNNLLVFRNKEHVMLKKFKTRNLNVCKFTFFFFSAKNV